MRHTMIAVLLTAGSTVGAAMPREAAVANDLVDQIRAHEDGIGLWWMGNAGWLIKADGLLIGIDVRLRHRDRRSRCRSPPPSWPR